MAILNPYISFKGNAREAMEFYKTVFGGELTIGTFAEFHMEVAPGEEDMVMHSQLTGSTGLVLMGSDSPSHVSRTEGNNISVSLSGTEEDELTGYWNALSEGAEITNALTKAPWGDSFGMLVDKFGINWLVNITAAVS